MTDETHFRTHLDAQLNALFDSLSGQSTREASREPVSAERLVSGLSSGGNTPLRSFPSTCALPIREWNDSQGLDLILVGQAGHHVINYKPFSPPYDPIDLVLYNLEGYPLPMKLGPGFLVRFILLEWDQHRLDRLLVAMKQSLREGAEAHITRLFLHDDHWSWRLQVTIYLGPLRPWNSVDALLDPVGAAARRPSGLIAAL